MNDKQVRGQYTQECKWEAVRLVKTGQLVAMTAKVLSVSAASFFRAESVIVLFALVANREHNDLRQADDFKQCDMPCAAKRDDQFPLSGVLGGFSEAERCDGQPVLRRCSYCVNRGLGAIRGFSGLAAVEHESPFERVGKRWHFGRSLRQSRSGFRPAEARTRAKRATLAPRGSGVSRLIS